MSTRNKSILITSFCGLLFCLLSNDALSQSNFYEGKTVTLIATTSAGGTGDLRVKAMVPFLKSNVSTSEFRERAMDACCPNCLDT